MKKNSHIVRAEKAFEFKDTISHPWNPDSIVPGTQLDRMVGLNNLRINILRIPSGSAASIYHSHQREEEWMYILRGQGVLELEGTEYILGPGDFAGFEAPSIPHQLRNPFERSLVCLMGGQQMDVDIADFPRLGKRMFLRGDSMEIYDTADAEEVAPSNLDEVVTTHYRKSLSKK